VRTNLRRCSSDDRGKVFGKKAATAADAVGITDDIMKNSEHVNANLPGVLNPSPFPVERRKYLAEKIIPHMTNEAAKNIPTDKCDCEDEPLAVARNASVTFGKSNEPAHHDMNQGATEIV